MFASAYQLGAEFSARARHFGQPLFVLAHQDDELNYAGLISRLGPKTRFVWVTNGDGLYQESNLGPGKYGDLRMAEAVRSVAAARIPEQNTRFLKFSEVEIYRHLAEIYGEAGGIHLRHPTSPRLRRARGYGGQGRLGAGGIGEPHRVFFDRIRVAVRNALFEIDPDVVFTLAWQGGQPEHDLTHLFTMLAIHDFRRERGGKVEFFHLPEYEYTILLAMRFHPFYRGVRYRIRLTDDEMAVKQKMIDAYASQARLFGEFRKVFTYIGRVGRFVGGPKSAEEYLSTEEFGPVPADLDYTAKPHSLDYFTYMFDHFEGTPVTFSRSIRPIVGTFI
ncbi:MAG: PIG-L family deacetylase [Deltaproteobacteria bacterium]|nr:PIG-L family deacetylase [Deltaproteobacteria bacterium]